MSGQEPKAPLHAQHLELFVLTFLLCLLFLCGLLRGDLGADSIGFYRVGLIPWSDAGYWVAGAQDLLAGELIGGPASSRPIYPAFLSLLLASPDTTYFIPVLLQIGCFAIVVAIAFSSFLSKRISPIICLVLPAFFMIWWTGMHALFMTENLGMIILILGITCLIIGLSGDLLRYTLLGFFLIGLSQAVRPWAIVFLATTPFLLLLNPIDAPKRWRHFFAAVIVCSAGFSCHFLASTLFNEPGNRYDNYLYSVYGQVIGGKGWASIYDDPELKDMLSRNVPAAEMNTLLLRKIAVELTTQPSNFIGASWHSITTYVTRLPDAFTRNDAPAAHFAIAVVVLFLIYLWRVRPGPGAIRQLSNTFWGLLVTSVVMAALFWQWFWSVMAIIGFLLALRYLNDRLNQFVLLSLIGIVLSLPFLGDDGGERLKHISDLCLYIVAARGLQFTLTQRWQITDTPMNDIGPASVAVAVSSLLVLLIFAPYLLNRSATGFEHNQDTRKMDKAALTTALNLPEIVGPDELRERFVNFDSLGFKDIAGKTAAFTTRFDKRDWIYLRHDVGLVNDGHPLLAVHWPLYAQSFNRSTLVRENAYALLPGHYNDLGIDDGQYLWLVGILHAGEQKYRHHTGFALVVTHLVYHDATGELVVITP